MKFFEVAPTKIVRLESSVFTYHCSDDTAVQVGSLVNIPVGKNKFIGLVTKEVKKPSYITKEILNVIEDTPLPKHLINLSFWMSEYYKTPLATVLQTVLPRGVNTKRRESKEAVAKTSSRNRTNILLNDDQVSALDKIMSNQAGTSILQGVTGSGKTEIYKELARRTIDGGRSVIVLVPEIGLTEQIVNEFLHDFPDAVLTHSQMTEAKRHQAWQKVLASKTPQVIIGPRSALFLPVKNLGAIILDEAHEPSYKQDQSPRYSALRVASVIGKECAARVVFGSATPLITDRFIAELQNIPIIKLDKRARHDVEASKVSLIDMTNRDNLSAQRFISKKLLQEIDETLIKKQQVLLFHNRRGSASVTLCESCGWTANCPRCFVPYILHEDSFLLTCHICNSSEKVPTSCPECHDPSIIHKGIGTKRIQAALEKLFPQAKIARFDSDNSKEETLQARYKELYNGEIDIIIGTQVVAKGLDLPHLRTVGVIQADSGLALPDYAASERTFQLLAQVVGRVGRDNRETAAVIQTYQPTHPVITLGTSQDYEGFYKYALQERMRAKFPPYRHLLVLTTVYKTEAGAIKAARSLAGILKTTVPKSVEVLGPTPSFYERQHGTYRWQLILKSTQRGDLIEAMQHLPTTNWQYELDPVSLL